MSIRRSATFTDAEYAEAAAVAAYSNRNFANYIVHCVMRESHRRLKDAIEAGYSPDAYMPDYRPERHADTYLSSDCPKTPSGTGQRP